MGLVSIGVEVQRNTDGDTPSIQIRAAAGVVQLSGRKNCHIIHSASYVYTVHFPFVQCKSPRNQCKV